MICFVTLFLSGLPAEGEVVARVNGEPIRFGRFVQELLRSHGSETLNNLVMQKIIETEMKRTGIRVSKEEIERELEREREVARQVARQKGFEAPLEEIIRTEFNMGLEEYKWRVLKLRILARKVLRPGLEHVSEAELATYFARHEERYAAPERRRTRHILVYSIDRRTGRPRTEAELSKLTEKIRARLGTGAEFAELAQKFSEDESTRRKGGDLGWMDSRGEGSMWARALRDAVFMLPEGRPGGPVQSPYGRHFLQVTEIAPGRKRSYDAVRDEVRRDYIEEQLRGRSDRWAKNLLSGAKVEILYEPGPQPEG